MRHIRRGLFVCLMIVVPTIVVPAFRSAQAQTQEFDLLIRGGHVIDPRNSIDAVMDVAVTGNKVALVAGNIAPARARQVAVAVSQTINERAVVDLPLAGRNVWNLASTTPGVLGGLTSDIGLSFRGAGQREIQNSLVLRGPKSVTTDLSMAKNVPVGGNVRLQVRVELYNAFNNLNYGNPGSTFGAATFGRTNSAGNMRQMQLGAKLMF